MSIDKESVEQDTFLNDSWTLYFHDPYNEKWDKASYITVGSVSTVAEYVQLEAILQENLHKGMFFLMRTHVFPLWDDEHNKHGGVFSLKILKTNTHQVWKSIASKAVGETLIKHREDDLWSKVTGVSVSPKKHFCIVKIWISDLTCNDPSCIDLAGVDMHGDVIFKKHDT